MQINPKVRTRKLSDLASEAQRVDWSAVRAVIQSIEPGDVKDFECPTLYPVPKFRSILLNCSRRIHKGDWRISSRTNGRVVSLFLSPR